MSVEKGEACNRPWASISRPIVDFTPPDEYSVGEDWLVTRVENRGRELLYPMVFTFAMLSDSIAIDWL